MCFSGPSIPSAPVQAPVTAKPDDKTVPDAMAADQRRRTSMAGRPGTILTGSAAGLAKPATTAPKTILGA